MTFDFPRFLKQITAIEDIEVAIAHLESTGWNLEVKCCNFCEKKKKFDSIFLLQIQRAVHLALEETSPPFSNDVNMLDVVSVSSEPVRDLRNEAGKFAYEYFTKSW